MVFNFSETAAECSVTFSIAQVKWRGRSSNGGGEIVTPGEVVAVIY